MTRSDGGDGFRTRFEIKKELGKGAMGEVYLAYDAFSQRDVAIKLAKLKLMEDAEDGVKLRKMWLNETRLAGKLRHPYIVEIYESGVTGDHGYLVMEYVKGGTLKPYAARDKLLGYESVIEIIYKVCNALDYANKLGLLHRDIKPANVLLTPDKIVKVSDFGTCYLTSADETQVFDVGTLPFMPPEHFKRRSPTVQSDIYAVGVMTYQLLTGHLPYQADSYEGLIYQKLHEEFIPIEMRRRDIPQELRFAVHRAIHADCEVRYSAWSEFCEGLALALPRLDQARETMFDSVRFNVLKHLPFFAGFSDTQMWETIRISNWLEKAEGEVICAEGTPGLSVYVVTSGAASVTRDGVTLSRVEAGECFGEMAYLDEISATRTATVRAVAPVVTIEIDAQSLRAASADLQAAFTKAFLRLMVHRIRNADQRFLKMFGA